MKPASVTIALAALAFAGLAATEASAWTRHSTTHTARGTYHGHAAGGCVPGACSRVATTYGPRGGAVTRSGTVVRTAPGVYAYDRTITGPHGGQASRSGTVVVTPGY